MHPLKDKNVIVMASNYIYYGTLEEVCIDRITLNNPSIIYETGEWSASEWKDIQKLPTNRIHIERSAVESIFEVNK